MGRVEIRIAGLGGQGIILSAIILGNAALFAGKNATQVQSYGAEARGGACRSEVVISDQAIYYPEVSNADVFLAMSQEAYNKYIDNLKEEGTQIVDEDLVREVKEKKNTFKIPATRIATDKLGRRIVANMVMLGGLISATEVVPKEALEKALLERVPKGTEKLNLKAMDIGYNTAELLKKVNK